MLSQGSTNMSKYYITVFIFVQLLFVYADDAAPVEDASPAAEASPAEATTPDANASPTDAAASSSDAAASSSDGPASSSDAEPTTESKPAEESTTAANAAEETSKADGPERAVLTLGPNDVTPENVVTDHYGQPVSDHEILNFTLKNGTGLEVYTEFWKTYYTRPATKPNCECITRAPLSKFKLFGNIHFPFIKVSARRYVSISTEPTSTICPPCDCTNCTLSTYYHSYG